MSEPINFTIDTDTAPKSAAPKKRGRPPGSTNAAKTATATAADVRQAMATLESAYDFTTVALTMFGFTSTAVAWVESANRLKATNEDALKAAPKLAASIARMGQVGGTTAFMVSHIMAVGGLIRGVQSEILQRRAEADAERPDNVTDFPTGA